MKNWIVNNFWIKVLSLVLAVITWLMVNSELEKEKHFSRRFYSSELYRSYLKQDPHKQSPSQKIKANKGYIMEKR